MKNKKQVIEILTEMQKWRRGVAPYDVFGVSPPHSPRMFGEAIDYAIDFLRKVGE